MGTEHWRYTKAITATILSATKLCLGLQYTIIQGSSVPCVHIEHRVSGWYVRRTLVIKDSDTLQC